MPERKRGLEFVLTTCELCGDYGFEHNTDPDMNKYCLCERRDNMKTVARFGSDYPWSLDNFEAALLRDPDRDSYFDWMEDTWRCFYYVTETWLRNL